jgi:aminopeptidase N
MRPSALARVIVALVVAGCSAAAPNVVANKSQAVETAPTAAPNSEATTSEATVPETAVSETAVSAPAVSDVTIPITTTSLGPKGCQPQPSSANGDGIGDALFPSLGNPGIDVTNYDLDLTHMAGEKVITATVGLDIQATAALETFTLDSFGPVVSSVQVDGAEATFEQTDPELSITPRTPLSCASSFRVDIDYTVTLSDAGTSDPDQIAGWYETDAGSFVINEPAGARTWMPSNDHPSDKAEFHFDLHVSPGVTAVANGKLLSHETSDTQERWIWDQTEPMATYLMLLLTGDYEIVETNVPGQVPLVHTVLKSAAEQSQPYFDITSEQISFFAELFGPYPFDSYGLAITDSFSGLAMETQGRSLFSVDDLNGNLEDLQQLLLSHELAHQWFGDAVSPARWQDIWLNESFATYGQWMWDEHLGTETVASYARSNLQGRQDGSTATGTPAADGIFDYEVYDGGAVVLHALRLTIGDEAFFTLLRRWVAENIGESRTSEDFISLAEEVSKQSLQQFFDDWLYATDLPDQLPS